MAGPGHWPDADMIPFGRIAIHSALGGADHRTHFTKSEQRMLMTLWCMAPSPLMLGMNLPDNDPDTLALITDKDLIAIDQDPVGQPAVRAVVLRGGREIWKRDLAGGAKAIGLFNRGSTEAPMTIYADELGLSSEYLAYDVFSKKDLGVFTTGPLTLSVPSHGVMLVRLSPP